MPQDRKVTYNGIAMAHLYVSQQDSASFNRWAFLCRRLPDMIDPDDPTKQWQADVRQIPAGSREVFFEGGGQVRARRYVIAVDCSPINGIPVGPADGLNDLTYGVPISISPQPATETRQSGRFTYRYDVIRDGLLELLKRLRAKILESSVAFPWNVKILLLNAQFGAGTTSTTITTTVEPLSYRATDGETVFTQDSIVPDNLRTKVDPIFNSIEAVVRTNSLLADPDRTTAERTAFYWGLPEEAAAYSPTNTRQIIMDAINPQYDPGGTRLLRGINAGTNSGRSLFLSDTDRERAMYYPFCDWSALFDYIRTNNLDGFTSVSKTVLPHIAIITGPTWPYSVAQLAVIRVARIVGSFRYLLYPNIGWLYRRAQEIGDISSPTGNDRFSYGDRPNPTTAITALRSHMGANDNWQFAAMGDDEPDAQLFMDYRALDPFCWGRRERREPGVTTPRRTNNRWTLDTAFPSYYNLLTANVPIVPSKSGFQDWAEAGASFASSLAPAALAASRANRDSADDFATDSTSGQESIDYIAGMADNMGLVLTKPSLSSRTVNYIAANPVHVLRECLLNEEWGRGKLISHTDLDDKVTNPGTPEEVKGSFVVAAEQVHAERMGYGYLWDRQRTLNELINSILKQIDGVLYERDGKIYLKLIGAPQETNAGMDADGNTLTNKFRNPVAITAEEAADAISEARTLTTDNVISVTNFIVPREDELVNRVSVQYTPHYSTRPVTIHREDDDRITRYGLKPKTIEYKGIVDEATAVKIAERDRIEESSALISCTINTLPEVSSSFNPNDIISLRWPELNIDRMIARIVKIRYGSSRSNRTSLMVIQAVAGDIEVR